MRSQLKLVTEKEKEHCYGNLGTVFFTLGDYVKANEYLEKALAIAIEIGDRKGEGTCYGNLGSVFISLGDYVKAIEYLEKALAIAIEIGDRKGEGTLLWKPRICVYLLLVTMSKQMNILRKHLRSQLKLVTEKEKEHVMET